MANKLYEETAIQDIADAIREKNGSSDTYTVADMGEAVRANIPSLCESLPTRTSLSRRTESTPSAVLIPILPKGGMRWTARKEGIK